MEHQRGEEARGEQRPAGGSILSPVQEGERIITLDVLRGVALLGIFFANMAFFAMPLASQMDFSWVADEATGNWLAWAFVKVFVEGKFISLFSILFGVGMMVQLSRAEQRGGDFAMVFIRRLFVLAVIGAAHALLIWYGDILLMYAVSGFALLLVQRFTGKGMLLFAAVLFVISVAMFLGMTVLGAAMSQQQVQSGSEGGSDVSQVETETTDAAEVEATEDAAPGTAIASGDDRFERFWEHVSRAQFNPMHPDYAVAETIAFKEGPLSAAVAMRAIIYAGFAVFMGVFSGFGLRIIAVFVLGAALMKLGFFKRENSRWHWRFFILGLGLGLPLELAVLGLHHVHDYEMTVPVMFASIVPWFTSIIVCLGYIGGVCLFVHSGALLWLQRALAAAGRMALTNYLTQSLVATFLFYWWGLGLFGEVEKVNQLLIALSVFVGQVIVSIIWLRFFRFGPMEWLWRSLTYWKLQPMLRG